MNAEKIKLMLEIAQQNPGLQIDKLIQLASIDESKLTVTAVEKATARKKRPVTRKKWNVNDDNTLIYMRRNGFTQNEIAKKLGRTPKSVSSRINLLIQKGIIEVVVAKYEKEELELMESLFNMYDSVGDIPNSDIVDLAELLKRSPKAVLTQLYKIQKEVSPNVE